MNKIVKNIKIKMFLTLTIFTIMIGSLYLINHQENILVVFRGLYGGTPLNTISEKMGFVLFAVLLQFTNADAILYCLNNADYLSIRFDSKVKVVRFLYKKILILNFMFVCLSGISTLFVAYLCGLDFIEINYIVFIDILLRELLACLIISVLQIYFLVITTEANTFIILIIITVVLAFLSQYNLSFSTILPEPFGGADLFFNILVSIALIILFSAYTKTAFIKKELY